MGEHYGRAFALCFLNHMTKMHVQVIRNVAEIGFLVKAALVPAMTSHGSNSRYRRTGTRGILSTSES